MKKSAIKKLRETMPYRDCVACIVFNKEGKVFVGQRIDGIGVGESKIWQFPQGGIDKNEEPLEAAKRELYEETSIKSVKLIGESKKWIYYDIPDEVLGFALRGKYRGQRQKYFAFLFEGSDDEINVLNPANGKHHAEFSEWRWVKLKKTPKLVAPFKKKAYKQAVAYFKPLAKKLKRAAKENHNNGGN